MFGLIALASSAIGAAPLGVEELGDAVEVEVTCTLPDQAKSPKKPVRVSVKANGPLTLESPAEVELRDGSLTFVAEVRWRSAEVMSSGRLMAPVIVSGMDKEAQDLKCTVDDVKLVPRRPSLEFQAGDKDATLDPGQPLFMWFSAMDEDDLLSKTVVTLSLIGPGVAGVSSPLAQALSAPAAGSGVKVTVVPQLHAGPPSVVLTLEATEEVSADTFNEIIRAVRLNPTLSLRPDQMIQVAVEVTDAEGLITTTQTQILPVTAIVVAAQGEPAPVRTVTLEELGRRERLTIECTVPNSMIQSTKDLRVSLTAESPIELDAKELVMSKAERTAVVTFDVGARWSEAQRVSSRSADVKAAAIDGEYAGTSCKPVTLTLQPKPPSIAVSAGGDGTRSFKPAAALFGEVLLSDEDALIESAEVVLSFTVQAGASLSEVYSELGRRVVLSVPDSEPGIVHSMAVDRRGLKPEVRLALVGRSSAASYQRVLSSILVSDELEMVGVMSVDVRVIVEDADGAVTQTNVSMPSQARQVDVYPQSVVRIRLVEYPRDGTNDPGRIAAVQNEYVFSRAQAGVEKILVQALVDQDVAVSTMKSHRKSAAIKYVDVSVVAHGAAPDWSMASRAVMARPAESADCDSARFLNDRGWCPGATLSLLREDEQGEITPNVQIDRDVYVRLELADGSFQVIGPRTVSATWWDNAPLYELSIATRPASFGVTHVYCQDIIDSGDASSLTTICENTPFDEYWTTGLNAAPVSLHARLIPFAKFPVLGLSADMALTVLGNSQQVLGYDEVLAADVAEQSSEGDGLTGQFQASVGVDLRLPINERPVDVMFYVGSYQRDIGGASRLRMTMGVALIAPILIADQNDVHNALSEP